MLAPKYTRIVAGAGPAGVAAVGALLHFRPNDKIAWVDPQFSGGRLSKYYRDVSSNTKVKLFLTYAEALKPFKEVIESTPKPNAITALRDLEQEKGCKLSFAADAVEMLGKGLRRHQNVDTILGQVNSAEWKDNAWTLKPSSDNSTNSPSSLTAKSIVLCTGSSPLEVPLPTKKPTLINLDPALDRKQLRDHLPTGKPTTIGIVGTSHSAVVIIMNLVDLLRSTHPHIKIKWFVRSDLLYAEEQPDGRIVRDNTGLKQAAADFAREHLEPGKLEASPILGKVLTRVHCPDVTDPKMAPELDKCDYIIQAIGYKRDPLPHLTVNGKKMQNVGWDPETGRLLNQNDQDSKIPQAYGAGIAFPRRVTDPLGTEESAVGMWKFMKHLKEGLVPALLDEKTA
ncbi:uncharacterized protein AB675_8907 [Cyphellophora attinorum]|uniref:FAD/NAD(P)-binding domain-containing protein n=1 Tax=Cyphellophora attinorum TaxID=1664694 RepID=A0A0N0NJ32_9EURO|nr:uncharacterized protein AB675_8907 [Phialophora attinorum]KPI36139.1 hypothetical protein AB675_8907 [Phialophora attinorum]